MKVLVFALASVPGFAGFSWTEFIPGSSSTALLNIHIRSIYKI
jgi:hypothetical protein